MWRRPRGLLFWAIVVLIVAACTEPRRVSPRTFEGVFALQSVDGQPVPKPEPSAPSFRVMLVSDTFAFDGRGHYTHRVVEEIESLTDSQRNTRSSLSSGVYDVSDDSLVVFPYSCPMGAYCESPPRGFLQPTGDLLLVYTMSWRHESRYQRLR